MRPLSPKRLSNTKVIDIAAYWFFQTVRTATLQKFQIRDFGGCPTQKKLNAKGLALSENFGLLALPFAAHAYLMMNCPFRNTHPRLSHRHSVCCSLPCPPALLLAAQFLGFSLRQVAMFLPPRPSLRHFLGMRDAEQRVRGLLVLVDDPPGPTARPGAHWLAVLRCGVCNLPTPCEHPRVHSCQPIASIFALRSVSGSALTRGSLDSSGSTF